ncbi:MAG TPA: FAD-dependent monooxygenase [Stellaceae bacterium]|jgi:salicylate hydroxylase|nr:FAD-dependent monooxygenase [Stellaceae bacterium]
MLKIAVIGGGIGGLSAAVALRQAGFAVDVYEQAPELTEIGGGINMGPNAVRVLQKLGLGPGLDRVGIRPIGTHQRRWQDGRTLQKAALNPRCEQLYGAPHMTIHRADLLAVIAAGFPAERVHLGHRLVGLADRGAATEAWFDNGRRITADVLVGADGIHSAVRAALFGAEEPRFAGCVAYRGLVPVERIADLGLELGNQSWVGPGGHFVHYFVSRGRLLNFVGWTEHDTWNREDWTDRATIERALAAFEGWHPQIRRIIAAADTCFIWALFDRDPLPRWSQGRTTLLGDSCHPMYPFMGQGAAQAIEDGAALAAALAAGSDDPAAALLRYERLRLPRVTRLQEMSRANKIRFHMPDGPAQRARDAEWARVGDRAPDALRWLYAHDPAALALAAGIAEAAGG